MDQSANQRDLLKQVADLETELELKKKQHEESEHELDKKALLDRVCIVPPMLIRYVGLLIDLLDAFGR